MTRMADVQALGQRIRAGIETVIQCKPQVVRMALVTLLAEGHLLIEDVPGVGKTMLSRALGKAAGVSVRRIQFTPDLLPSDITGVSVFNQNTREFEFRPGGVFANILIGDEINRASPKTQAAMLECMEERQVTADAQTYPLQRPFMVVATQNPIEMVGTHALPEAQLDRFMIRVSMGYPVADAELAMLDARNHHNPLAELEPATDAVELQAAIEQVADVHADESVQRYAVAIASATRHASAIRLGASPRATLQLLKAGRANAALEGRDYVIPDDLRALAPAVLAHRVLLSTEASMGGRSPEDLIAAVTDTVAVPDA